MLRDYLGTLGFVMVAQMALAEILLAAGAIAYAFSLLIFALTAAGFSLKTTSKSRGLLLFLPAVIYVFSIVLSYGFLAHYSHIPAVLSAGSGQIAALSLLIGEFGTVISSVYLLTVSYSTKLETAGYEMDEVEESLNGITTSVLVLGFFSLVITILILFVAGEVPTLNIGLLPAILLFGTFYVVIFRFIIKENRREKKG